MIKGVLFDIGGVVIDDNNAYVKQSMQQSLGISPKALQELWDALVPLLGSGKIDEPEFWHRAAKQFGARPVGQNEDIFGESFARSLRVLPEVQDLLRHLGGRDICRVAISNTIQNHAAILRRAGVYDNFDDVILSHEIGMRKPDPAVYALALDRNKLNADEVLLVDDRLQNLEPAKLLGIKTILAVNGAQIVRDVRSVIGELGS